MASIAELPYLAFIFCVLMAQLSGDSDSDSDSSPHHNGHKRRGWVQRLKTGSHRASLAEGLCIETDSLISEGCFALLHTRVHRARDSFVQASDVCVAQSQADTDQAEALPSAQQIHQPVLEQQNLESGNLADLATAFMQSIEDALASSQLSWGSVLSVRVYVKQQSALCRRLLAAFRDLQTVRHLSHSVVVPITGIWGNSAQAGKEPESLLQLELLAWNLQI